MSREPVLSRQILTYMLSLTFIIVTISVAGSWLFYTFITDYIPGENTAGAEESMNLWDWIWVLVMTLSSLVISLFFTVKLSSRILTPLNTIASSLKKISAGDLSARALCTTSMLGEINSLVKDFNEMAEKLQTLDEQRNLWNAAIAHELRTPVTILRGRLQGLVEGVFGPDPILFEKLLRQTEGLNRLIEDLRVVSSAGGAGYLLDPHETDLQQLITHAIDVFTPEFESKGFTVITELTPQLSVCDALRMTQCLTVLFDNALHYSTSPTLVIKNGMTEREHYILVQDEGPGIPPEFQPLLFQPFQRGISAREANPKGCGLGLSVVRAIMQAHGGNATCMVTSQQHSIFRLAWPAGHA